MKRYSVRIAGLVFCLALMGSRGYGALFSFSDNFDSENGGVGALNYGGFDNWSVSNGTVDLIGNGYYDFLPGHGLYVDMDGSTRNAGIMSSTFDLDPGDYVLRFFLAGNNTGSNNLDQVFVRVGVNSALSWQYSLPVNAGFTEYTQTFSLSTSTAGALSFEGFGGDNIGMLLDNVSLTGRTTDPVPEPGTMALLGSGLLGLVGVARRKMKK